MRGRINHPGFTSFSLFKPKNLVYFALGLGTLMLLWRHLLAAVTQENFVESEGLDDTQVAFQNTTIFYQSAFIPMLGLMGYLRQFNTEYHYDDYIFVQDAPASYSDADEFNDIRYVNARIESAYTENLSDKCALDSLINHYPDFKIFLVPNVNEWLQNKGLEFPRAEMPLTIASGFYFPAQAIVFQQQIYHTHPAIFAESLSISLGTAMQVYTNYVKRQWSSSLNGKPVHLHYAFDNASESIRLTSAFSEDIARIFRLHNSHLKLLVTGSSNEQLDVNSKKELKELNGLIYLSNYKHAVKCSGTKASSANLDKFLKEKKYQLNSDKTKYLPSNEIALGLNAKYTYYILEYYINHICPVVFTLTNPADFSSSNLLTDLLTNLVHAIKHVQDKTVESERLNVMYSHAKGMLAPYSHEVGPKQVSLLRWLFPASSAILEARAPTEHQECMKKGRALPSFSR
jgi:hypothetical protein